jgi:hypothetical protein
MLISPDRGREEPVPEKKQQPLLQFVTVLTGCIIAGLGMVIGVCWDNIRLLASWHGFLHTAIANQFAAFSFPPENPFFAGETLPYYWLYHFVGYWLSQLLGLDLLHTFHLLSGLSLIVFIVFAVLIGRTYWRSTLAGVVIAWLGLAGLNPLGPGIALAKHFTRGVVLEKSLDGASRVETTFVTNAAADDLMTEPLLPAMYVGSDWRYGQNLMWFFDIASRAPALALLMALIYLLLKPEGGWRHYALVAGASLLVTAFSALIGLSVAAALVFARRRLFAACLTGALLALPTYYQMFFRISGGGGVALSRYWALAAGAMIVNFLILGPLAFVGARKSQTGMLALAGLMMLVVVVAIDLPEGNEHNIANAAQCLLAVPAGAAVAGSGRWRRVLAVSLFAAFLPVTLGTLQAYAHRPPMPLGTVGRTLHRLPADSDLEQLYQWIRRDTKADSIFVIDPSSPVKMSGNVSELPAFTGRALFTDLSNYLTSPNRDARLRAVLAGEAIEGKALNAQERQYLAGFHRPVYVLSHHADRGDLRDRLSGLYGSAKFHQGSVAVFQIP